MLWPPARLIFPPLPAVKPPLAVSSPPPPASSKLPCWSTRSPDAVPLPAETVMEPPFTEPTACAGTPACWAAAVPVALWLIHCPRADNTDWLPTVTLGAALAWVPEPVSVIDPAGALIEPSTSMLLAVRPSVPPAGRTIDCAAGTEMLPLAKTETLPKPCCVYCVSLKLPVLKKLEGRFTVPASCEGSGVSELKSGPSWKEGPMITLPWTRLLPPFESPFESPRTNDPPAGSLPLACWLRPATVVETRLPSSAPPPAAMTLSEPAACPTTSAGEKRVPPMLDKLKVSVTPQRG